MHLVVFLCHLLEPAAWHAQAEKGGHVARPCASFRQAWRVSPPAIPAARDLITTSPTAKKGPKKGPTLQPGAEHSFLCLRRRGDSSQPRRSVAAWRPVRRLELRGCHLAMQQRLDLKG